MNTTNDPDDGAGRGPEDPTAPLPGAAAAGNGPTADDVRPAMPPPPPPVGSSGTGTGTGTGTATGTGTGAASGEWQDGASGSGWSGPAMPPPPTDRRSLLIGIAGGAGAVVVLGAVLFALWPDRGGDSGADAAVTTSATSTATSAAPTAVPPVVTNVDRTLPATQVWTAMGVTCAQGDVLRIAMSGSASHDQTPSGTVGPSGLLDPVFHQYNVEGFPDANTMTVIGSLDQDPNTFFVVGDGTSYICPRDGGLYLGVNDRGVDNNSGAFLATITRTTQG
ncbi:hypothetical protein [Cellulomonas sp. URHB0016]